MTAAKRIMLENETPIDSIAILPNERELRLWQDDIAFRNQNEFTAWATEIGHVKGFNMLGRCMIQNIKAAPAALKKAWLNAWPEHETLDKAARIKGSLRSKDEPLGGLTTKGCAH